MIDPTAAMIAAAKEQATKTAALFLAKREMAPGSAERRAADLAYTEARNAMEAALPGNWMLAVALLAAAINEAQAN